MCFGCWAMYSVKTIAGIELYHYIYNLCNERSAETEGRNLGSLKYGWAEICSGPADLLVPSVNLKKKEKRTQSPDYILGNTKSNESSW